MQYHAQSVNEILFIINNEQLMQRTKAHKQLSTGSCVQRRQDKDDKRSPLLCVFQRVIGRFSPYL
jgi:hypothetical protein